MQLPVKREPAPRMFGLVNLHKPSGMSSRTALDFVTRAARPNKVGHAGTLDPIASGVLIAMVGPATRLTEYVQQMPKRYLATFQLGVRSASDDIESELEEIIDAPTPSPDELIAALPSFLGDIWQRPPAFSAVKIGGQRAYHLARKGRVVEPEPKLVTIYSIDVIEYDYPRLVLDIGCGSGTYVRSLGRDLAVSLGTGAVMTELVRTSIGPFSLQTAILPETIDRNNLPELLQPATLAVGAMPRVELSEQQCRDVRNGLFVDLALDGAPETVAAFHPSGELAALLRPRGPGSYGPLLNFAAL